MWSVPFPIPFSFAKIKNKSFCGYSTNPFSKTFMASAFVFSAMSMYGFFPLHLPEPLTAFDMAPL